MCVGVPHPTHEVGVGDLVSLGDMGDFSGMVSLVPSPSMLLRWEIETILQVSGLVTCKLE